MTKLVSCWHVEENKYRLRRLGKALEENNELGAVLARCIIQGVDEIDPSSGKTNRQRMQEEVADVYAQLRLLVSEFNLDGRAIYERIEDKLDSMNKWEELLKEEEECYAWWAIK